MLPEHIHRIIERFRCFESVEPEDWQHPDIAVIRVPMSLAIRQGGLLEHAIFTLDGSIRVYKVSDTGREITLYRVRGGECCVLMMASIMGEMEYEASASVETPSELFILPIDVYKQWVEKYKPLRQYIYRMFTQRMSIVTTLIDDVAFKPMEYRIADFLLHKTSGASTTLRITHDEIAVELGTAREVISRKLKEFEKEGWLVLGRGRIQDIQRAALEQVKSRYVT